MNKTEASIKYHKYKTFYKHIKNYKDIEQYIVVNDNDRRLLPIYIPIPEPPDWKYIDGFGLPANQQMFQRVKIPSRLQQLEKQADTIEEVWEELENNAWLYKDEIEWIKKQIYHEIHGYFFFNNGQVTYIPGEMYIYLNFWYLDVGLPEYRDRDRRWFLFNQYIHRLPNFCGFNSIKHRRAGDTSRAALINYLIASKTINGLTGIQSKTDKDAYRVFKKHLVRSWRKLPFYLKPRYSNSDNPQGSIMFAPASVRATKDKKTGITGSVLTKETGLDTEISFRSSAEQSYDGDKLYFHHGDEVGKTTETDIFHRHDVVKECTAQGSGRKIFGHCLNTSTVEEMEKKGGRNFKILCDQSMFHDQYKNESGRTDSWLATLFLPAFDGLEGFCDQYGMSIIDKPTKEQLKWLQKQNPEQTVFIGAKKYLEQEANDKKRSGIQHYFKFVRKYPTEYKHCWISSNADSGMPLDIIEDRISELAPQYGYKDITKRPVRRGNFVRKDPTSPDGIVVWVDDEENGRFVVSYLHKDPKDANRRIIDHDGMFKPEVMGFGIAGGDPFGFTRTEGRRHSNGGGSVFRYRTANDGDDLIITGWEGGRFICTYNYRADTKDEYCEDMIMMCQYYGVLMNPEVNRPDLVDYFMRRGYGGYLKYFWDSNTGRLRKTPGFTSNEVNKQKLFRVIRDYLRVHGMREMHLDFLEECLEIEGIEKMTDFDLFTACGAALMASEDKAMEIAIEQEDEVMDIGCFFYEN